MADPNDSQWERKLLEKIALESLTEQRRRRRWGVFFRSIGFLYVGVILAVFIDWKGEAQRFSDGGRHTALVQMQGVISAKSDASAENVLAALQSAFNDKNTAGVVLLINSPGGSPVQAGIINDEIRRQRHLHPDIPLYAVVEDICASGGYYVAVAADRIYVDKASIVGSIGVLMDGFGFTGTMQKLGVERRLLTAGSNKGFLDPFSPESKEQKTYAQEMLGDIHQQFIKVVREGRGTRLKETPDIFSGLMWTGAKSIELGLSDAYGTVDSVAREVIKAEDIRDYTVKPNFAEKFAQRFGADAAAGVASFLSQVRLH
ncbi:MAG: S49 family peptidase [Proteobacteria bacterium]|nr:S49 family peptidase [Pseudomonadota bacterium]HQR03191.1 S49 family peptidase [Rhodocyclaceae bacterium]